MTIWKHVLFSSYSTIPLPRNAEILTVQIHNDLPVMWIKLDEKAPKIMRNFVTFGTGDTLDNWKLHYIATYQLYGYVGHVFEVERPE